jgi:hypothetical protein
MSRKTKMILVGRDGRPSMRKVYQNMTRGTLVVRRRLIKRNKTYYRLYTNNNSDRLVRQGTPPSLENSVVIRWGTREELPSSSSSVVYNKSAAIANATDKKGTREILTRAGISVPRAVSPDSKDVSFPVIARPSVHSKGRNFVVIKSMTGLENHYLSHAHKGWYYSEYVDKDKEYRFHIAHGKVLAIMEKPRPDDGSLLAWNRALTEDPFVYVPWNKLRDTKTLGIAAGVSIDAVKELGLDFGGVDVMTKGRKAYIIEVNTAPTLNSSDYVAERYSKYFDWLLRSETRREHFERKDYEDRRNYMFYNNQLEV